MGLTTWKNAPDGRILKSDVSIAKNYLQEKEIRQLERAVTGFFDYIEDLIERENTFSMSQFSGSVNEFLAFRRYQILPDKGRISAAQAKAKADSEYANAQSIADLAGGVCTAQSGTIWYDTCLPQIENANILPAQETAPAMLVALNSGACDIVVTDHPTGQAALTAYPDLVMLDFGGGDGDFQVSDEDINIGISMKKGNTALKDAINKVLATMTTDDYNTMMDEAISVQPLSE